MDDLLKLLESKAVHCFETFERQNLKLFKSLLLSTYKQPSFNKGIFSQKGDFIKFSTKTKENDPNMNKEIFHMNRLCKTQTS